MTMLQLNEKQRIAVEDPAKFKAIVAPAGSGKTKTLISAILDFRTKHTNDKIVAITFTRKAAAELKERLGVILNAEVSTIHSWSWKRLQDLAVKYDFKVQLLDDDAIKDILKRICRASQQYYLNQFQLFAYVMGNYNIDIDDAIKRTFERMRKKYVAFKKQHQLYDFTDLPQYLYDKLQEYNEEIYDIDGFFVDEFQDIDPVQLSLFNVVHAHTKVYIGDYRQAIYHFRGSVNNVFEILRKDGFSFFELNVNYRSYQSIIDAAESFYNFANSALTTDSASVVDMLNSGWDIEDITPSEIICNKGEGGGVYFLPSIGSAFDDSGKKYAPNLLLKKLLADKGTQILCRANKQVKKIKALGIESVSTIHQAKGLEYDNVILIDFPFNDEEGLNIAYVGMTRAKNILCIADFDVLLYLICNEELTLPTNKLF